jgi:hypothetical protein
MAQATRTGFPRTSIRMAPQLHDAVLIPIRWPEAATMQVTPMRRANVAL